MNTERANVNNNSSNYHTAYQREPTLIQIDGKLPKYTFTSL